MIKNKVLQTIKKHNLIETNSHIILGLSGGPDSVCLFHILRNLQGELGIKIHGVHINHMMRSGTNDRDEEFARNLCEKYGVDFHSKKIDCKRLASENKITSEEAGRIARYGFFRQVADQLSLEDKNAGSIKIAVAHNGDDQVETLLFRIMRGTGIDGLSGMEYEREEGKYRVIRPLLDVSREEIEAYLEKNDFDFVTDETNLQSLYTRNKIRLQLIPFIKGNFDFDITGSLTRLANIAAQDKDYIWQQAKDAYSNCLIGAMPMAVEFDQKKLKDLHMSVRRRVILMGFDKIGLSEDISSERILAIDDGIGRQGETKQIQLPRGYKVTIAFGKVILKDTNPSMEGYHEVKTQIKLKTKVITDYDEVRSKIENLTQNGYEDDSAIFDGEAVAEASGIDINNLNEALQLRGRMEGDFICLNGGKKKLKKLLAELKIPADERDKLLIAAAGKCVLVIGESYDKNGHDHSHNGEKIKMRRFAEKLKVTNKTRIILDMKFV